MDGIDCLSHIIPYIQLFNGCGWTALDGGMAEGEGFEPSIELYTL